MLEKVENVLKNQNVPNKNYVLGISLGITLFILFIGLFIFFYIFLKKKMQKKHQEKLQNSEALFGLLKKYSNEYGFKFLSKTSFTYDKDKFIFLNGPILLFSQALVLTHPIYLTSDIEGNCIEREWFKKLDDGKKNKIFPNPILSNDLIIKQLQNIVPKKTPIIILFVFLNEEYNIDIYNEPGHAIFAKLSELDKAFGQITTELTETLSANEINAIIDKFNKLASKK
ncbi:hypothetical protein [Metamycoplasma hyosynoviae]|uniref:NERD domain-containing protein n=1 Tax=Metamycoplasma hyosynoviae TaxID=29559 RepID=A0A9Q9BTG0_9BACT|nr:hypothetical protein [Metamycoplasma hyosynoviae]MDC8911481.1 hypothetical protein [Metamycoplasma hyosynoviae]MDD1358528.1 hypothetical protein [Metamycoplasma hyosynoviae]MDD1359192.1 hypothetical protein [Metamycoplasma hyosynoviae]MDD1361277.1 hypothetical protein [Metamycoplasma hyosynoviae]MDD1371441.1 hypothetical protein [Metamycoplasma hyosynoviae]